MNGPQPLQQAPDPPLVAVDHLEPFLLEQDPRDYPPSKYPSRAALNPDRQVMGPLELPRPFRGHDPNPSVGPVRFGPYK